jgi:hypothetical protein
MLPKKTVFIVGAGASHELGLPVGDTLKDDISRTLRFRFESGEKLEGSDVIMEILRSKQFRDDRQAYVRAAADLSAAMPLAPSIDNYLHTHSADKHAVTVGKMAIAECILRAESKTKLVKPAHTPLDFSAVPVSWHGDLVKILFEGLDKQDLGSLFDNFAIITFNYDRCIEQYFAAAIQRYFKTTFDEAHDACNDLEVFHVYGQVGLLPWQKGSAFKLEFGTEPNPHNVLETMKQIRTFTEQENDEKRLKAMHKLLVDAELVVYLGFSFGRINLDLLTVHTGSVDKQILGTAFNVSEANVKLIREAVHRSLIGTSNSIDRIELPSHTCHDFMQHFLWDIAYSEPN